MSFPINLDLFGFEINAHALFEILAYIIGFRIYVFQKSKTQDSYSKEERLIILIAAASGGLIFSRLIGALENTVEWFGQENFWLYLFTTKTIVGGFIGGWLFVELTKIILKKNSSSGDVMTFPIIIALIIGRIGCFTQGIHEMTYGNPTDLVTGMDLGDGIQRHPLALYEIFILVFIGLIIMLSQRRKKLPDGLQFRLFMLLYLGYRFFVEWLKPNFPLFGGLTSIHIIIIITYIFNLKTILNLWRFYGSTLVRK